MDYASINIDDLRKMEFDDLALMFKSQIDKAVRDSFKIHHGQLETEDMYQECLIALWQALEKYNPQYTKDGVRTVYFPTFLDNCLRNQMLATCRRLLPIYYEKNEDATSSKKFKIKMVKVSNLDTNHLEEL